MYQPIKLLKRVGKNEMCLALAPVSKSRQRLTHESAEPLPSPESIVRNCHVLSDSPALLKSSRVAGHVAVWDLEHHNWFPKALYEKCYVVRFSFPPKHHRSQYVII
jgi:hypothetical protein